MFGDQKTTPIESVFSFHLSKALELTGAQTQITVALSAEPPCWPLTPLAPWPRPPHPRPFEGAIIVHVVAPLHTDGPGGFR